MSKKRELVFGDTVRCIRDGNTGTLTGVIKGFDYWFRESYKASDGIVWYLLTEFKNTRHDSL